MTAFRVLTAAAISLFPIAQSEAGARTVTFVISSPDTGRAWYIKEWYFHRCVLHGINPWNRSACRGWQPISSGVALTNLAGQFCTMAEWGRAGAHRGSLEVQSVGPPMTHPIKPTSGTPTCP